VRPASVIDHHRQVGVEHQGEAGGSHRGPSVGSIGPYEPARRKGLPLRPSRGLPFEAER
jgi:hypothetical protein